MSIKCIVCSRELKNTKGLSVHLTKDHKYSVDDLKLYYDKYIKKENEGKCYFCENEAIFKGITQGYHKICSSKECLGKTRATGTYDFLMYKYNLSKDDAIKLMNERAEERGKKIKDGLQKQFENNEFFFKEKSRQCVEFWIKKGYSLEDAEFEVKKSFDDIHIKTWKKRRKNPELYQDVNTTQIGYWMKKGYTEKESKYKISERQKTFTLERCIERYGDVNGLKIWNNRQINWSSKMKNTLLTRNYRRDSSKPEIELVTKIVEILNLNSDEHFSILNQQFFIYDSKNKNFFTYDFVIKNKMKVIEFNGDYWHCNPLIYKDDFFNKNKQKYAKEIWEYDIKKINNIKQKGYEVLVIWESDYKENKELAIQKCINFINS